MSKYLIYITVFLSLLVVSCQKELDFKDEYKEPKLVINSVLESGKTVKVSITSSLTILSNKDFESVENVDVRLLNGNDELIEQLMMDTSGYYIGTTVIAENTKYKIVAEHSNYNKVSAEVLVPVKPIVNSIDTQTTFSTVNLSGKKFTINISDNATTEDYYMIELVSSWYQYDSQIPGKIDSFLVKDLAWLYSQNIAIENSSNQFFGGLRILLRDDIFNGKNYKIEVTADAYLFGENNTDSSLLRISKISTETFNYFSSIYKYNQATGNPFANPVQVYSNIENGFGIFGGTGTNEYEF